jgi:multisubunit Na+/H+ antiporter MnhB subunit
MTPLFGVLLAVLLLAVAVWTVRVTDTLTSIVSFIAYGLLLGLVWVRLGSIDVALTEAAIGGGLTGVLLLRAGVRMGGAQSSFGEAGTGFKLLVGALCATISIGLATLVLWPPEASPGLAGAVAAQMPPLGLANPVTAVLLGFRALDTLLEIIVLLLALLGVWSLGPDRLWGGIPGPQLTRRPDETLVFFTRVLIPFAIVYALHVFWAGADAPGGKFQAGTILAAAIVLATMAGIVTPPPTGTRWLRILLVVGPGAFLAIGFFGVFLADGFLAYPDGWAKPLIIVIEAALLPSLALILALVVLGPPERRTAP